MYHRAKTRAGSAGMLALTVATLLSVAGCADSPASQPSQTQGGQGGQTKFTPAQIQSELMSQADGLFTTMADTCDRVIRRTSRQDSKVAACGKRLGTAMGAISAATERNAHIGYIDLMTLVMLQRLSFEDPWAKETFDEADRLEILATLVQCEKEVWDRGAEILSPQHVDDLRTSVLAWKKANPDQVGLAFVKLQEFGADRQIQQGNKKSAMPSSIFSLLMIDPLANLDPASRQIEETRLMGERIVFWSQRLPLLAGWQMEYTAARMARQPPMDDLLKQAAEMNRSAATFAASTTRLSDSYDKTLKLLPEERKAAIEQLDHSAAQLNRAAEQSGNALIDAAATRFSAASETTVDHMGKAFGDSLKEFAKDLKEGFGSETSKSIEQSNQALTKQQGKLSQEISAKIEQLDSATDRMADRLAYRLAAVGLLLVAASGVMLLLVGWVNRRAGARSLGNPKQ